MHGVERERERSAVSIVSSGFVPAAPSLSPVTTTIRAPRRHGRRDERVSPRAAAGQSLELKRSPSSTSSRVRPAPVDDHAPQAPHAADAAHADDIRRAWLDFKRNGCAASRDLLIIHYMSGHVRRIAHRLSAQLPRQIDPEDLVQHVYRGLVRLMERFDPERDVQFETFSSRRLVGAMRDYLRDLDTSGRQSRQRAKQLAQVESRFHAINGRRPDRDELQDLLGVADDDEFRKFIDDARTPLTVSFASGGSTSSEGASGGGGGWDDADGFAGFSDQRLPPPLMRLEREDLRRWLTEGLARRDRLIVVLYYYEQMTMKEIGRTLGCSESRVSQRLDSIIQCLRARLSRVGAGALE